MRRVSGLSFVAAAVLAVPVLADAQQPKYQVKKAQPKQTRAIKPVESTRNSQWVSYAIHDLAVNDSEGIDQLRNALKRNVPADRAVKNFFQHALLMKGVKEAANIKNYVNSPKIAERNTIENVSVMARAIVALGIQMDRNGDIVSMSPFAQTEKFAQFLANPNAGGLPKDARAYLSPTINRNDKFEGQVKDTANGIIEILKQLGADITVEKIMKEQSDFLDSLIKFTETQKTPDSLKTLKLKRNILDTIKKARRSGIRFSISNARQPLLAVARHEPVF